MGWQPGASMMTAGRPRRRGLPVPCPTACASAPPPRTDGHRSLSGQYGFLAGTQGPERLLPWPMGIRPPGAMRRWACAVDFVGGRHFDAPRPIEFLFEHRP